MSIPLPRAPAIEGAPPTPTEVENLVPGTVADAEVVRVGLGPSGATRSIVVDQTLTINGVGDFAFTIPGPAADVTGPRDSVVQPGLRLGDVSWAGFSSGQRVLRSRVTLVHERDIVRHLPVAVSVAVRKAGRPVTLPAAGPLEVEIRVADTAGDFVSIYDAVPDRRALGGVLDRLYTRYRSGQTPVGGSTGIPRTLDVATVPVDHPELVLLPVDLDARVTLTGADVTIAGSSGGAVAGRTLSFAGRLSPDKGMHVMKLQVPAGTLAAADLRMNVGPVFADQRSLAPPNGQSWRTWSANASTAELRRVLRLTQQVMWRAAQYNRYTAYLGNPGAGPSKTSYIYSSISEVASRPAARDGAGPGAFALVAVAAALIIADATVLWRRS